MNTTTKSEQKIAVIGPTQSGKTCLAVGLYSTSTNGFTIEPVESQGNYLGSLKAGFANGVWPDPTNKSTVKDVRLDFCKEGKAPVRVSFPEFAGETLASPEEFKAFANAHLRDLDGVVLLINPGAEAFQSGKAQLLEDAMAQYKRVLSFLRDENSGSHKAFVALTVTAADRIAGDLAGKLEPFTRSVEELANTLTTSGFRWKRFDVTVTGRLKEQDKPELAKGNANSASAPFLWLLDKLHWLPIRRKIIQKICRWILAVGILVAVAGVWCGVDAWNDHCEISKIENNLKAEIGREHHSEADLVNVRKQLADLRNWRGWFKERVVASANFFEPAVWKLHEEIIRQKMLEIAANPESLGNSKNCASVDEIFNAWTPTVDKVLQKHEELKKEWENKKPDYLKKYAFAQMLENIKKPLVESDATHGDEAFKLFAGLYGKLSALTVDTPDALRMKDEISEQLDLRVAKEWCEFAIPSFDQAAQTNASHENTCAFVTRLGDWKPVTTNGLAAKAELYATVTNSVPAWRTRYEAATHDAKIAEAVKSGAMEELAKLYPPRVATNDYLTIGFVSNRWENKVKGEYETAEVRFHESILGKIKGRNGRLEVTHEDKDKICEQARSIGEPFDADAILKQIQNEISCENTRRDNKQKSKGEAWAHDYVKPDRKRTGQSSLWHDYETFIGNNNRDSIAREVARKAVYGQCEKWFEDDCRYFNDVLIAKPIWGDDAKLASEHCKLVTRYDNFKNLCKDIVRDKNPDTNSWAYWFAKYCFENGHCVDGIYESFPQKLVVNSVSGEIDYYDEKKGKVNYPFNYKRTCFAVRIEVVQHNPDGSIAKSEIIEVLPFKKKGLDGMIDAVDTEENACDKAKTKNTFAVNSLTKTIHLFEEVRLFASATDVNRGSWNKSGLAGPIYICGGTTGKLDGLQAINLSFDLNRNTGCDRPKLALSIDASIEGDSIFNFLEKAKQKAAEIRK